MTLAQLKALASELNITADQARAFGHIGHKATWEAAIEQAKAIATAATAPANTHAATVCDVLYSETSRTIVQWVAAAVLATIYTLGLIVYRIAQVGWQSTAPTRQRLAQRRDDWLIAQASYAALVLLIFKGA
ncbi:hypothetical protein IQ266_19000 [filamentous cyanobacterium LEGE 11480]|uniref:Uncharacterized protein n=1 Tax=Romeriopsis navalis LEGE 11480 TaxID=2777977 RepID=A0A928VQD9_9CYAN|nr:hypothetical protein [Romeriopsis navalis]MBE9031827.1 hypothetical protein [Romeriopsis navalis LEGE 11480]